ncbi:adrenodoxin-like [Haliotis asinina]|uniref:adrenodoxin-like n=1 Tax=Haliotis asinina TaxID=109174 RepID=UPI0035322748
MAGLTARVVRCIIPKFAFTNHPSSLTVPGVLCKYNRGHDQKKRFSSSVPKTQKETVTINFIGREGNRIQTKAKVGDNLLDVIIENDIDIDGFGACEGTLACSTCHLIFKKADYDKLPEKPTDEELDMLDLAYGLSDTSRLGCQILVSKDMDGLEVEVPSEVSDARGPS